MFRRVPLAFVAILVLLIAPATVAAAGPQLLATVIPGKEIDVVGSGFPASTAVTLVITRNGNPDETRTLGIDAAGAFTTTIDAGPGRGGAYTLVATAGQSTASADVVAVETAGGTAGGVLAPPPTSTQPTPAPERGLPGTPVLATLAVLVAGITGARWAVRRRGTQGGEDRSDVG
jgi:hypothetical protein